MTARLESFEYGDKRTVFSTLSEKHLSRREMFFATFTKEKKRIPALAPSEPESYATRAVANEVPV